MTDLGGPCRVVDGHHQTTVSTRRGCTCSATDGPRSPSNERTGSQAVRAARRPVSSRPRPARRPVAAGRDRRVPGGHHGPGQRVRAGVRVRARRSRHVGAGRHGAASCPRERRRGTEGRREQGLARRQRSRPGPPPVAGPARRTRRRAGAPVGSPGARRQLMSGEPRARASVAARPGRHGSGRAGRRWRGLSSSRWGPTDDVPRSMSSVPHLREGGASRPDQDRRYSRATGSAGRPAGVVRFGQRDQLPVRASRARPGRCRRRRGGRPTRRGWWPPRADPAASAAPQEGGPLAKDSLDLIAAPRGLWIDHRQGLVEEPATVDGCAPDHLEASGVNTVARRASCRSPRRRTRWRFTKAREGPDRESSASIVRVRPSTRVSARRMARSAPRRTMASRGSCGRIATSTGS